ncbi:dTDP-glucose 4,6-dehydratase [Planomicrobium stackebrandtii]|uniref:dTDP-glucose 4,6-dehydratase n=1 Tax=Planomicrobium stackebrandtii TaxID=253160 RepID=A0ABU0GUX7_9BACL|nr:GDP-mannose 4,6-dehydratase [Planomicrobium stackebrandtii]MDQ0428377.1 dTDP-glucose 4,6-dehydratase [Planomicrobium stackebrandtii]
MSAKTILITGGHGFIGSNMIHYYLNKYPDYQLVNIDYNTEAANPDNIPCPDQANRYSFHRVDIRNAYAISHLFELYDITDIIHFAAETRSQDRVGEIRLYEQTNVLGTMNLLHAAQSAWMAGPHQSNPKYAASRFHHLSLAETECGTLYSESKQRAGAMIQSFHREYGLNVVTTASPEVFGPMQQEDELVPRSIRQALEGNLVIPEQGRQRNWLFIVDLCEAVDTVFHLGEAGSRYEIDYNAGLNDRELAKHITALLNEHFQGPGSSPDRNEENGDGLHSRASPPVQKPVLGFAPFTPFKSGLRITLDWYIQKYKYADFLRRR